MKVLERGQGGIKLGINKDVSGRKVLDISEGREGTAPSVPQGSNQAVKSVRGAPCGCCVWAAQGVVTLHAICGRHAGAVYGQHQGL